MKTSMAIVALIVAASGAGASVVELRVTAENLSPANSISFAPLRVGFHDGTFDTFNVGETATAPIISIAEGGSGSDWFPFFASQQPNGTSGTVANGGPILPGASASVTFNIDSSVNKFFSFASMVVPSNDYFIGNDGPASIRLFDDNGVFVGQTINQFARDIWDAGSELDSVANAAFIPGSNNGDRIAQGGVVSFDFEGLSLFNGLTTAAGYTFDLQLEASSPVFRISFEVVPAPSAMAVLGLGGLAMARRRRG
jgi:hypothetical protein